MAQKVRLTTQSLKSVLGDVRREDGRVEKLTKAFTERGFRAVVEDIFDLSDQQRARLDAVINKGVRRDLPRCLPHRAQDRR